ncbi:MAG TPA: ABC transporter permease [Candidatus Limnocylindria bacterium]|jgi:simple sugar transport system permease protein
MLDAAAITDWGSAAMRLTAPLAITVIGGVYAERSGVFNIGMEGMMLVGAFTAVSTSFYLEPIMPAGLAVMMATLAAMLAAALASLVHAYLTISRGANQIISGVAINLMALGLTNTLHRAVFGATGRQRVAGFPSIELPVLGDVPIVGDVFFNQSLAIYLVYILPLIALFVLYRTTWGLNIRAAGDAPSAVDTAGLSVSKIRYATVLFSGAMAGLGGAVLALGAVRYFTPGMTAGRGFIVLGAIIVGRWNPLLAVAACLLFGAADAFQLRAQAFGLGIPHHFFVMLPYLLATAAVAGVIGRVMPPTQLGINYRREDADE